PLHSRISRVLHGRSLGALLSTLLTVLLCVVPLTFLLIAVSNEIADLYRSMSNRSGGTRGIIAYLLHSLERIIAWGGQRFGLPQVDLQQMVLHRLEGFSGSLTRLGAMLVSNALSFLFNAIIATVILFFLYRDGDVAVSKTMAFLPFRQDRMDELRER